MQSLTPTAAIRHLVASVRNANDVALNVRMEAGARLDNTTYDRPENWHEEDHQLIHETHAKSHLFHFMARLDVLVSKRKADKIFVAANLP